MTAKLFGYNPPFLGGPQNVMSRQEDEQLVKNDILQLLLTIPGERVMRPGYGVNLRNAVFEPNDTGLVTSLQAEIRQQIEQYDNRVIVDDVQILTDRNNNAMSVRVLVRMRNNPLQNIVIEQLIGNNGP